ncbi:MAG: LamG-like jellyroll fold domain-containing protein [Candidatus Paceibacterota bacterium]
MNRNIKTNLAFTLIELLVVIAIIGILSALIIIGMSSTTQKASVAKAQVFANSLRNSLMADMVSEWKLDGNTNDTWAASFANNGTWWGTTAPNTVATYGTASECVSGQCMDFDGVDDMVDFGSNASLSMGTKDHTVSLWVKFDNATATDIDTLVICGAMTGTGKDGYWITRLTDRLYFYFTDGEGANTRIAGYLSAAGTLIANNWYQITVTMDRDGNVTGYINGTSQISWAISPQPGDVQNSISFRMGAFTTSLYRLAGKMDEVRIFHAITTISQIEQNYFAGLNKLFANRGVETSEYQQRLTELSNNYARD